MNYAVLSDSHDNLEAIRRALQEITARGITKGFHLGDFVAPFSIEEILKEETISWECVFGNNDGDGKAILEIMHREPRFTISQEKFCEVSIDGKNAYLTHYPNLAETAAASGKYNAVFHGHTHKKRSDFLPNNTLLANPGELTGVRYGTSSFGIWDSEKNSFEIVNLTKA
jgi:putative phosphoesterase